MTLFRSVGDPFAGATMATGDAMNLAARLEQQAQPGDVVVGETAYDQVRDLVEAESLGDLDLRGHESAVKGWWVTAVASEVGRPRGVPGLQSPLTGRDEELALLLDAAGRAERERKAILFDVDERTAVRQSAMVAEPRDDSVQLPSRPVTGSLPALTRLRHRGTDHGPSRRGSRTSMVAQWPMDLLRSESDRTRRSLENAGCRRRSRAGDQARRHDRY
jgi:hypothetical protein